MCRVLDNTNTLFTQILKGDKLPHLDQLVIFFVELF